ncbi:MAG: VTT domain-containing protein [Candidatus Omnitrophica bacterium]|nr:VTT domain-containing protein [Candidatus Omnitrophota bacterium]
METIQHFFSNLYRFDELIRWGGYFVLVIIVFAETGLLAGFFLPGDSLLVTAGLIAAVDGPVHIVWLNLFLSLAAVAGDTTGYWIGYYVGPRIFNREDSFFFHKNHLLRTQKFYDKYGAKTIVLARFVPIVRTFAPTVAGVGKMEYKRFLSYNVIGGISWVMSMTLAGYFLGQWVPHIEKQIHWVILVVIVLSFIPIIRELLVSKSEKRSKEVL